MKNHNVKMILVFLLTSLFFYKCIETPDEKKKKKKEDRKETINNFYNAFALAGGFQSKDPCTDVYWTGIGTFVGYIVLYNSNKMKDECAGVTNSVGGSIYYTNGNNIATSTLIQQSPRTPLQCKRNDPSLAGIQYSDNSWYKQDASNTRNANFIFKHTLQKDANGNTIGMDSFINYNSGDILYCCNKYGENPICGKLQIN